jgi:hypothetical protein
MAFSLWKKIKKIIHENLDPEIEVNLAETIGNKYPEKKEVIMKMKSIKEYRDEYFNDFVELDNEGLINRFNNQVGVGPRGPAGQGYCWALKDVLRLKYIDFSAVGDERTMSYAYCVILKEKKLVRVIDLSINEIEPLFRKWVATCRPEMSGAPYVKGVYKDDNLHIASGIRGNGIQMTLSIKNVMLLINKND